MASISSNPRRLFTSARGGARAPLRSAEAGRRHRGHFAPSPQRQRSTAPAVHRSVALRPAMSAAPYWLTLQAPAPAALQTAYWLCLVSVGLATALLAVLAFTLIG